MTSISALQIWGLSPADYPYDGYLLLKLEFLESDVGVAETFDALVLVCPDPVVKGDTSILVGTNTPTVRRLLKRCREKGGESLIRSKHIHPVFKKVLKELSAPLSDGNDQERGAVWFTQTQPVTLWRRG